MRLSTSLRAVLLLGVAACGRRASVGAPAPLATVSAAVPSASAAPAKAEKKPVALQALFAGAPLTVDDEDVGLTVVPTATIPLGLLDLPSGRVAVGDPIGNMDGHEALLQRVPPGKYRVEVLVEKSATGEIRETLAARVVFSDAPPTRWVPALNARTAAETDKSAPLGYPADGAAGCFVDGEALVGPGGFTDDAAAEGYGKALLAQFKATRATGLPHGTLTFARTRKAGNLIAFSLGGDQVVPSYWGFAEGIATPVALVSLVALRDPRYGDVLPR